ncbi:MAG: hypothetical protein ACRCVT_09190 [Leadbetterella sp.]
MKYFSIILILFLIVSCEDSPLEPADAKEKKCTLSEFLRYQDGEFYLNEFYEFDSNGHQVKTTSYDLKKNLLFIGNFTNSYDNNGDVVKSVYTIDKRVDLSKLNVIEYKIAKDYTETYTYFSKGKLKSRNRIYVSNENEIYEYNSNQKLMALC